MNHYVLKSVNSVDIVIDEAQQVAIMRAFKNGETHFYLESQRTFIMLKSIGQIVPEETVREEERNKLALSGRFKCKYGNVHFEDKGCLCWQQAKDEPKERKLMLPESIQDGLKKLGEKMSMSGVSYDEVLHERVALGEKRAKAIIKRT